jgi:hypothetical protein
VSELDPALDDEGFFSAKPGALVKAVGEGCNDKRTDGEFLSLSVGYGSVASVFELCRSMCATVTTTQC